MISFTNLLAKVTYKSKFALVEGFLWSNNAINAKKIYFKVIMGAAWGKHIIMTHNVCSTVLHNDCPLQMGGKTLKDISCRHHTWKSTFNWDSLTLPKMRRFAYFGGQG